MNSIQDFMLTTNNVKSMIQSRIPVSTENPFLYPKQKSFIKKTAVIEPLIEKKAAIVVEPLIEKKTAIVEPLIEKKTVVVEPLIEKPAIILEKVVIEKVAVVEKEKPSIKEKTKEKTPFFIPKQKDTLFWCFYVIKNGFSKYEFPDTTSFANEKTEKFKWIDTLRANKQLLKMKKIKNIKEHVEDDLGNKDKISMKTFIALCVAENINILFIHKRKCFDLVCVEGAPYHVIHQLDNHNAQKYGYEEDTTQEKWDHYKNNFFNWESLEKPLKAMSSYTLDELWIMYKKLIGEEVATIKKSKKDLYEYLVMSL